MNLTFASVASGIEAASVAFIPLGWRCAFTAENAAFPSAVIKHRWPDHNNYGDLLKYREWPTEPTDLLIGGTPCQSFSVAGLRKGLADPRGNLALTFLAVVERYAPTWVVWENVPGVLSSDEGQAIGAFLGGLGQLGYGFAYTVLDAQYFGLAQRRRRVFVVGHLGGLWQRAAAVLFDRESMSRNSPPRRETGQRTASTLAASPPSRRNSGSNPTADAMIPETSGALGAISGGFRTTDLDGQGAFIPEVAYCLQERDSKGTDSDTKEGHLLPVAFHGSQDPDVSGDVTHPLGTNQGQEACIAFSSKDRLQDVTTDLSPTLRSSPHDKSHANGGAPPAVCIPILEVGKRTGKSTDDPRAGIGVGNESDPMFTLQSGAQHGVATPMAVRRLTPLEFERLQGFPDNYTRIPWRGRPAEECSDGPRYKALGNAFPVPVISWIGRRIELVETLVPL